MQKPREFVIRGPWIGPDPLPRNRYQEGNRAYFTELLKRNILSAVKDLGAKEIRSLPARLLLTFKNQVAAETISQRISAVFGVANFSIVERTAKDIEALRSGILNALDGLRFDSFRVETQRGDKTFPLTSPEINRQLGAAVKEKSGARVDLTHPEFTVTVEVLPHDAFFGFEIAGAGGLPVGASGRVVSLISGGFDSPVAAYRMMQRGCRLIFVHFHGAPYQDKTSQEKVRDLVQTLTRHQFQSRLYIVPFGEIQRQIVASVARPLRVVLYRRMMLRIAEVIARNEKAKALVTGESLGRWRPRRWITSPLFNKRRCCRFCARWWAWTSKRSSIRRAASAPSRPLRYRIRTVAKALCPSIRQPKRSSERWRMPRPASMSRNSSALAWIMP